MDIHILIAAAKRLAASLPVMLACAFAVTGAAAHPHVFVDAKATIVFDAEGRISAVANTWEFDEAFTAFAVEGLDANGDGKLSASELAPLAKVNIDSLKEYDYFTYLLAGEGKNAFATPTKYHLEYHGDRLTLFFTLPLKSPVAVDGTVAVEIFDPEYFVAFTFVEDHPVSLTNAPPGCAAVYQPPHELDADTMAMLAAIPVDQHDLPPDLLKVAVRLANLIKVNCAGSGAAVAAVMPPDPHLSPHDTGQGTLTPADVQLDPTVPPDSPAGDAVAAASPEIPATTSAAVPSAAAGVGTGGDGTDMVEIDEPPEPAADSEVVGSSADDTLPPHSDALVGMIGLAVAILAGGAAIAIIWRRKSRRS